MRMKVLRGWRGLRYVPPRCIAVQVMRRAQHFGTSAIRHEISATLLSRARAIAAEHDILTTQLAETYDASTAKRAGELAVTARRVRVYDDSRNNLTELTSMYGEDKEVNAMVDEEKVQATEKIIEAEQAVVQSLLPEHPFAQHPCLLEIRPGAGGDEAALFAGELLRMYQAFCARQGFNTTLLKYEEGSGIGSSPGTGHVLEAILEVDHPGAYNVLRSEAGVHRVQRVPVTESKGRTHTSAVSVLVLPSLPTNTEVDIDDPSSDYYIDEKEVRTDIMRASGAGGQHVNKTESAVRLTHLPTNTVVFMQESRSQPKNREAAWSLLRSRLAQQRREQREAEIALTRRSAGAGKVGRENKIRTYNWGQQRVTDHRSGFELRRLDSIMAGEEELDSVMDSVRVWMSEQDILALESETKP